MLFSKRKFTLTCVRVLDVCVYVRGPSARGCAYLRAYGEPRGRALALPTQRSLKALERDGNWPIRPLARRPAPRLRATARTDN